MKACDQNICRLSQYKCDESWHGQMRIYSTEKKEHFCKKKLNRKYITAPDSFQTVIYYYQYFYVILELTQYINRSEYYTLYKNIETKVLRQQLYC